MKRFNTAGPCRAGKHYVLPPLDRLPQVSTFVEAEQYFVLKAPRQTGKTTCLLAFEEEINRVGQYAALYVSVERAAAAGPDVEAGVRTIIESFPLWAHVHGLDRKLWPPEVAPFLEMTPDGALHAYLARWAEASPKPIVLFIDEIDALRDETLLSVLRQLRSGYLDRPDHFPQSIALVGLRDIRDYRIRIRPERESLGTASPFNISVEALTLQDFTREEVGLLYGQHTAETGQELAPEAAELAYELTRGQPWLVNALARQVVEKELRNDFSVTIVPDHVVAGKEALILRRDTHLDSLIDRLREERVRRVLEPILAGEMLEADILDDDVAYCRDLGLIALGPPLHIANPIYAEVIPRALTYVTQLSLPQEPAWYIRSDGALDMEGLLQAFQEFFREHSEVWLERFQYKESGPHLLLMAFLQRIVNAGGRIEREFAVGTGRVDLCVCWRERRYALELKIRRSERTEEQGLKQLSGYLEHLGLSEGHLVLFDRRPEVSWEEKLFHREREVEGRRIAVWGY